MSETHSATVNRRHYTDCGLEDWRANVLLADPEVEEATCAECFRVRIAHKMADSDDPAAERDRLKALNAEMLEALKCARHRMDDACDIDFPSHISQDDIDPLDLIIAKAEGKQQ